MSWVSIFHALKVGGFVILMSSGGTFKSFTYEWVNWGCVFSQTDHREQVTF